MPVYVRSEWATASRRHWQRSECCNSHHASWVWTLRSPVGRAHANGDAFVVFRNARVTHAEMHLPASADRSWMGGHGRSADTARRLLRVSRMSTGDHGAQCGDDLAGFVDDGELNRLFLPTPAPRWRQVKPPPEQTFAELKLPTASRAMTWRRPGRTGEQFQRLYTNLRK